MSVAEMRRQARERASSARQGRASLEARGIRVGAVVEVETDLGTARLVVVELDPLGYRVTCCRLSDGGRTRPLDARRVTAVR